jgi:hypothetical protein
MKSIAVGDRVEVLDEALKGVVRELHEKTVVVELDEGFELEYSPAQLIRLGDELQVSNYQAAQSKNSKDVSQAKRKRSAKRVNRKEIPALEVDLHAHHLSPEADRLEAFEILNLQLDTAKRQLGFALSKKIQRVVFIHGVGQGVLKTELEYLLKKYSGIEVYAADFQKYGWGATEVYLYQNAKEEL